MTRLIALYVDTMTSRENSNRQIDFRKKGVSGYAKFSSITVMLLGRNYPGSLLSAPNRL